MREAKKINRNFIIGVITAVILLSAAALAWRALIPAGIQTVTIGGKTISVEIASSATRQEQGLSQRQSLAPDSGMLFVFAKYQTPKFWMKDMLFPLDIIWIRDREIVGYEQSLPPAGPNPLATYEPLRPVNYVLEVKAGFVRENNIKVGDRVSLK